MQRTKLEYKVTGQNKAELESKAWDIVEQYMSLDDLSHDSHKVSMEMEVLHISDNPAEPFCATVYVVIK